MDRKAMIQKRVGWSFSAPLFAAAALVCSCDGQPAPAGPASSPAAASLHPAMQDTPSPVARASGRPAASPSDPLPPGHPPIGPTPLGAGAAATDPTSASPPPSPPSADKGLAAELARIGLVAQIPAGWTEVASATGGMVRRMGTLRIPKAAGDASGGEMSVMLSGGGLEGNIERWRGQFQEKPQPVTTKVTPGGLQVTVVEMEGTFSAGPMGGGAPQAGTKLLGAIVTVPGLDQSLFLKSWGPKATMEAARSSFDALVGSLKPAR